MEQRRIPGNSQWYHETQASLPAQRTALMPEAATVSDRFLLGLVQQADGDLTTALQSAESVLHAARILYQQLFPETSTLSRIRTLTLYDRLSTALTVAQVTGIQRLCNHYAARLNPLPGPDSSRESNRRLTQITEYARQLAGQPTLIDAAALQRLEAVGLTTADIITYTHIIGFVSFQARVVSGIHALMALPVRWLPGITVPPDAETISRRAWRATIDALEPRYAVAEKQAALASSLPESQPESFIELLSHDSTVLNGWGNLQRAINDRHSSQESTLAAAVTSRINGSSHCFYRYPTNGLCCALEKGIDEALKVANPQQKGTIQLAAQLTRSPERFSAAQVSPLRDAGFSTKDVFSVILHTAAAGWGNRLMQSFGNCDITAE